MPQARRFTAALGVAAILMVGCNDAPSGKATRQRVARSVLSGRVVDQSGPVVGARVRVKGRPASVLTDREGRFRLDRPHGESLTLTAWKEGYFIAGAAEPPDDALLKLRPLPTADAVDYHWIDPTPDESGEHNCGNCHEEIYRQWQRSGHSRSAAGRRFLNLYDGSDWHGRPQRGWSLLRDHPDGAGVCAACHAPTVEFDDAAIDDIRRATGVGALGVHCDYCHKIKNAPHEFSGLDHGRFALELLRPAHGQLFFGPLDDVDRDEDTYSPLQQQSRYCASCHEGIVFGVHVYSTYSEWLASPAAQEGRQCQSCHMTPNGKMTNIAPHAGGIERDPQTLGSHSFLPGGRAAMLRRGVKLKVRARRQGDLVTAEVIVAAGDVGHRVPTGFIDRHLILLVEPLDAMERVLQALEGERLPPAAGESLAGRPGRLFAKLLADQMGNSPVPFWRAGVEVRDTRLVPGQPVTSRFAFPADTQSVRVRVIYRRFWEKVAKQKEWPSEDIVVHDKKFPIVAGAAPPAS